MPEAVSAVERDHIYDLLRRDPGVSWAEIGRDLGRHPSTIAREVNRNGGCVSYRSAAAQRRCERNRRRPRCLRLGIGDPLRQRVIAELLSGRSPEAIWADLDAEQVLGRPCVETIYAAVFDGRLGLNPTVCLRTRRRRRRHRQARCSSRRPALPNIADRPDVVNDRVEPGHWEADHIIGAYNQSAMLWLTERVTRYAVGVTMPEGYTADAVVAGVVDALERIPAWLRRSLTFDQSSEWAGWETIATTYGLDCWFCDPHSPWQRDQTANQNRARR